jgi:agmatinase
MTPDNFLGLPGEYSGFDRAAVLVLPIPFEATVSYGGGTAGGADGMIIGLK